MRKTKRLAVMLLMMVFFLGGCKKEKEKQAEYIDGFEVAEYEKYDSYASENGLGGTIICIEGKVLNQTKLGDDSEFLTLALVVEQKDGNRWCVSVASDSPIEGITDKDVRIFGTYLGFSDVMNLPELAVSVEDEELMEKARIEIEENGKWVEVWKFYTGYAKEEIDRLESSNDSSENAENSGNAVGDQNTEYGRNKEIYLEEAPGSEENILQSVVIESEKTNNGDIVVFVTNNNPYSIPDLDLQAVFYKDGNIVDTDTDGHDVLVPGNTVVSKLDSPNDYDDYEVKATVDWKYASSYRNWIYNLNVNSNVGEDGIIVQFENAGNIDIEELEYIVVFYNENAVSDTSHPEDIRDVKAGSVVIEKVPTYRIEFDGYGIYINQAHTFFNSDGEVIKDTVPENIGKDFIYPTNKE